MNKKFMGIGTYVNNGVKEIKVFYDEHNYLLMQLNLYLN